LTGKSYSDGTPAVSYSYDAGSNGKGQRTGMSDAAGSVTWSYDSRGQVVQEKRHFGGSYDMLDNVADPGGDYVTG
jgi:YD repeat-containing protein